MSERRSRYTMGEPSFDELARGLAVGTVSRRKALRLVGAALVGGALASLPGAAWAARGGNSACAKYCSTLFTEGTAAHEECVSQGTRGTGPCFACGGPGNPAPTCGINQTLNTTTCRCEGPVCPAGSTIGTPCGTCLDGAPRNCFCNRRAEDNSPVCTSPISPVTDCSDCSEGEICLSIASSILCLGAEPQCFACARPCPPDGGPCFPS